MPTTTNGFRYPASSDAADAPTAIGNLAADVDALVTVPQILVTSGGRTLALTDGGKHIYVTTTASQTITIPANSSVAFAIGSTITIINESGGTASVAITTDTLVLAGAGTTGTRTLANYAMATLVKVTSTKWFISGNGVS